MKKSIPFIIGLFLLIPCLSIAQQPLARFSASDTAICGDTCTENFTDHSLLATGWKWYFPGAAPDTSTVQNPTNIVYNNYGCYPVKLIAYNKYGTDTLIKNNYICLDTPIRVKVLGSLDFCQGQPATTKILVDEDDSIFYIYLNGVVTQTYTLHLHHGPCSLDTSFTVHVDTMPTFVFKADTFLCQGQSTTIYAYNPRAYGYKYLWNTGETTDSLVTGPLYKSQTYYVTVSKGACSKDSSQITIKVHECGTGIENYTVSSGLQIFPNPAGDELFYNCPYLYNKDAILTITDVTGRIVKMETVYAIQPDMVISIPGLAQAIYFLRIQSSEGIFVQKFVKD